ncbi:MAG: oligosaccharide flippase family protein [Clostridia bacterium]|nr:oligosaccharide flippase family protein [Clostridia bacterium]
MPQSGSSNEKKKLFGGVAVLMPATLFTKIIGLFYKIPLIAIVGVTGMAYFLAAYHIYSMLFVLSATGLPTALSLQIARSVAAGQTRAVRRIFGVALTLFLSLGLGGTVLLLAGAPALAARLAMADAAASIVAIAPALLLAAFIGAAKGYFQGHQRMVPTALSEVLEAAGKLGFGLGFALLAKHRGLPVPVVAAYAIFGITAGLALAALVLAVLLVADAVKRRGEGREGALPSRRGGLGELLRVALPVTVSASVMSLVTLIDTALISGRLQAAGFAPAVANAMYSSYGNLAVPLYNLVPSLLSPITLALMPLLGAALSKGEAEGGRIALSSALRLSALVSIPAALGLGIFARPILSLIYAGQNEAIELAAPLLSILALSVVPAALITLTGAALQATGHTVIPVLAMGAGALVKLALEVLLLPMQGIHIYGAPISTLACNLTVLIIEAIALSRALPFGFFSGKDLFRPFAAALFGVAAGAALYFGLLAAGLACTWLMLPVLFVTAAVFALLALRFGAVAREDLFALPAGDKICGFLIKYKLIK